MLLGFTYLGILGIHQPLTSHAPETSQSRITTVYDQVLVDHQRKKTEAEIVIATGSLSIHRDLWRVHRLVQKGTQSQQMASKSASQWMCFLFSPFTIPISEYFVDCHDNQWLKLFAYPTEKSGTPFRQSSNRHRHHSDFDYIRCSLERSFLHRMDQCQTSSSWAGQL
ncbi:hypothetical protein VTO42DRAFT_567 [Malbranchea cinnamomea]